MHIQDFFGFNLPSPQGPIVSCIEQKPV